MLKKRIIPKFLLRNGRLVKYVQFFEQEREAGNPVSTARVYNDYGADEFIILDIAPSEDSRQGVLDSIAKMSEQIFMPFTVGGGVRTLEHINDLLRAGADKISVNTQAVRDPGFVKTAAQPVDWALRMQDMNCGEILITSIDRDGTLSGYDVDMIARLNEALDIPLVVSGGCGGLQHCIEAFNAGASAGGISSLFLFTDHSPIKLRSHLVSNGINVRASTSSRN